MGIDSDYYKEKNKKQLTKLRMLEAKLPPYVTSYLDDKELSSQVNTVIAYAYDLQTFFRFLTEKNTMLKNTVIKDITIDFLENLTFEDINEYQRYLRFNNDDGSTHQNQDKGIARRMAALRGFFEFACTHQYMKNNPTVGAAKRIKMPQKDIIRLNDEEVNDLLNVVSNTNIKGNKLQIQKCQKLTCFYITRMRGNCFLKLHDCNIIATLSGIFNTLVIFFDCLVHLLQLSRNFLYLFNKIIGNIIFGLEILTENPFYKRFYHFSSAIINKTEKVSGCYIRIIIL